MHTTHTQVQNWPRVSPGSDIRYNPACKRCDCGLVGRTYCRCTVEFDETAPDPKIEEQATKLLALATIKAKKTLGHAWDTRPQLRDPEVALALLEIVAGKEPLVNTGAIIVRAAQMFTEQIA